jgi:hypothetical protein
MRQRTCIEDQEDDDACSAASQAFAAALVVGEERHAGLEVGAKETAILVVRDGEFG